MSIAVLRIDLDKQSRPFAPPPLPEGAPAFEWCLRFPDRFDKFGFATAPAEIVGLLLRNRDYAYLNPQAALVERIRYAMSVQVWQQARLNFVAQSTMQPDWDDAAEWERELLNGSRVEQPHGWPSRDGRDVWTCNVPLILLTTGYAPYCEIPAPEGNVWWLDPLEDESLLASLEDMPFGLIDVFHVSDL